MLPDDRIRAAQPLAKALAAAVGQRDQAGVARVLKGLETTDLHALAIVLAEHANDIPEPPPPPSTIIGLAAYRMGVTEEQILAYERNPTVTPARQVAMAAMRYTGLSYPVVGRRFKRDHSTVYTACQRVAANPKLDAIARDIARTIIATPAEDETPDPGYRAKRPHAEVDEVVVQRLLDGQPTRASRAERAEAVARWKAAGNSERSLTERFGWHAGRYSKVAS